MSWVPLPRRTTTNLCLLRPRTFLLCYTLSACACYSLLPCCVYVVMRTFYYVGTFCLGSWGGSVMAVRPFFFSIILGDCLLLVCVRLSGPVGFCFAVVL